MSDTFNHKAIPLSSEHMQANADYRQNNPQYHSTGWCAASRKCQGAPTHLCTYRYVTGRAGRVTTNRRELCAEHTEAFIKKNKVGQVSHD